LVENLLNISRIESGRLQFDYQVQPLDVLVNSVFEELKPKAKEKNIRFTYRKTKKKLPPVKIDEEKIRQVIMNMVDNAIKYTKKGSVTITLKKVVASDKRMGECLEFKVSDSGMGVSADDLPNLFKKFSRGTGTSLVHTEGTGLGLYVAKQMVEAHGGKVWAESKGEGKGSKFCFRIPIKNKSK
jgi:signal transduction histidine kinase